MNRKNIITIVAGILLIGVVAIGVYFASQAQLNQSPDLAFACDGWTCGCGTCGCPDNKDLYSCNGNNPPPKPPGSGVDETCGGVGKGGKRCEGGKQKVCAGGQMVYNGNCCNGNSVIDCPPAGGGSGGSTGGSATSCSGSLSASACKPKKVGDSVSYDGGVCTCTRTTGENCSCVPAGGTVCKTSSDTGNCKDKGVGAACIEDGKAGTCVSTGVGTTSPYPLSCGCQLAPNNNNVCTGTGTSTCGSGRVCQSGQCVVVGTGNGTCTADAQCLAGKYCRTGTGGGACTDKGTAGADCSKASACLSGICTGGKCATGAGDNAGACSSSNPCTNSNTYCNAGTCVPKKGSGSNNTCSSNVQCQSGFCIANVCRDATAGSCEGGTYKNGQWKCEVVNGQKTGMGDQCSNGVFDGSMTKTDACAPQVSGGNCATLPTQSAGEISNGRFVGCSGALNCFCQGTTGSPNCIPDNGNDSCGAGTANTGGTVDETPAGGGGSGTTTTGGGGTTNPPSSAPYCGDAVCATNELCERSSAGSTTYRACSATGGAPTGAVVASCYGVTLNQPVASTTCKWCGDGVYTPGTEQCDASAPASGGNNPTQCDASCHLQNVANVCVSMTENGVDPIRSGASNFVEYTLIYQHNSTTNPFPNIRLLVSTANTVATAVGRDANSTSSALVAPIPVGGYAYDNVTSRHTYRFRWESTSTAGVAVPDATYQVRALTDGTNAGIITSPTACTESLTASAVAVEEPLFNIIKSSAVACVDNSDATINYTVTVTNNGPVTGVIDFVTDTLDPLLATLGITPGNINPAYGSYSSGVITWTGTVGERTFSAGQSRTYTYSVVIPVNQLLNFAGAGVQNLARVQYDTNTTTDNSDSFNLRTILYCTINGIPITGIFDDGRFFLFGLIFIILGFIAYRYQIGKSISEKLITGALSTAEVGVEKLMPFEDRIERKMDRKMKDEE